MTVSKLIACLQSLTDQEKPAVIFVRNNTGHQVELINIVAARRVTTTHDRAVVHLEGILS